jgi:hypothetical protein
MSNPEVLTGKGYVLNGNARVGDVEYEVRVYRQWMEDRSLTSGGDIPRRRRFECVLDGLPNMPLTQDRFTLVMDDARKLNFYFTADKTIVPTGKIYE